MKKLTVVMILALVLSTSCGKKGSIKISGGGSAVSISPKGPSLGALFNYGNKEYKLRSSKIMKMIKLDMQSNNVSFR